jgi:hypothetical protein
MTRALATTQTVLATDVVLDPVAARMAELTRLLETAAHYAHEWYGATYLLVDRTTNPDTADVKVLIEGTRLVDLWDLNPILWDDAHWAAIRAVEVGQVSIVRPVLHRD